MKCFVISPIGNEGTDIRLNADKLLNHLLKPVCKQLGYEVIRADTIDKPGSITKDIFDHLRNDDLAIVDVSSENLNVGIELGYRIAVGKPLIIVRSKQSTTGYPFDIADLRRIDYGFDISDAETFKSKLKNSIQSVLSASSSKTESFEMESSEMESSETESSAIEIAPGLSVAPFKDGYGFFVE